MAFVQAPGLPWRADERGMTGAEKALLLCVALAVVVTAGALVRSGSRDAADAARRTLVTRSGGSDIGAVVAPMAAAGTEAPRPAAEAPAPPDPFRTLLLRLLVLTTVAIDPYPIYPPGLEPEEIDEEKNPDGSVVGVDRRMEGATSVKYPQGHNTLVGYARPREPENLVLQVPVGATDREARRAFYLQALGGRPADVSAPGTLENMSWRSKDHGGRITWVRRDGTIELQNFRGQAVVLKTDGSATVTDPKTKAVFTWDRSGRLAGITTPERNYGADTPADVVARLLGGPNPDPPPPPKLFVGADPPKKIGNMRELAEFVCDRYKTGAPIGIVRIASLENTYLVVLSGTEFLADGAAGPKQATYIPEDLRSAFRANDDYRDNIIEAMKQHKIPKGASVIVAGHSLGGMEAQNIVTDRRFRDMYKPIAVVTYGSPLTTPNQKDIGYARFSTPGDPVVKLSPISAPDTVARTAAWGGHYILRPINWVRGAETPRPVAPIWERYQNVIGPDEGTSIERHNRYRSLPELEKFPLGGPDGKPFVLDTEGFRTYTNPRTSVDILPYGRIKR